VPVVNDKGGAIGELYLKIDDYKNKRNYYAKFNLQRNDIFSTLIPLFGMFTGISGLLLWFLLPTWVYVDARQRDMKNASLWGFLTLISGIFGFIVYLIVRPTTIKKMTCPVSAS